MFLGNLLFAGVLGKSTGNANLAALIQKNAERVDPSFRTHKAEHVGISTRDVSARFLKAKFIDWFIPSLEISKEYKALIKSQPYLAYLFIGLSVLSVLNYIGFILVTVNYFYNFGLPDIFNYAWYDATGGIMLFVLAIVAFLTHSGGGSLLVWAPWGFLLVLVNGIFIILTSLGVAGEGKAKAGMNLVFMLLNSLLAVFLLFLPSFSALKVVL